MKNITDEIDEGIDFAPSAKIMTAAAGITVGCLALAIMFGTYAYSYGKLTLTGEYTSLINVLRGKKPLVERKNLVILAESRAKGLCKKPFSHSGWTTSFDTTDYAYIGENLAKGYSSILDTFKAWLASSSHKANMLDSSFRYTGVGSACGVTVQLFGGYSS